MIRDSEHALVFGSIDLIGYDDTFSPYWFNTYSDGTSWGNPVQAVREIESFLMDGAIQVVDGYGNREMTIVVAVMGEDSYGLAAGEQALMAEVGKRNTLTWTPPNIITGSGTPSVFDVVSSVLDHQFDDQNELRLERRYQLTITALPWARSGELTTVVSEAPPAGVTPTITTVDACTSLTGWASGTAQAATVSSGSIKVTFTNPYVSQINMVNLILTRSGLSANMTTTPYVRLEFRTEGTGKWVNPTVTVSLNGIAVTPVAQNGNVRWYLSPSTTLTSVKVHGAAGPQTKGQTATLYVDDISRSDMTQDVASGQRQTYRTLEVEGSTRTQGNLFLSDPTAALGSTLVYTVPPGQAGAQPPLRPHLVAGPTETTDASVVSGKRSDLSTNHSFTVPAASMTPGGYLLMARVKHATAATYTLTWTGMSVMGSSVVGALQTGKTDVTLAADTWTMVQVAKLTLPTTPMGGTGRVRVDLSSAPAGVLLDEAWLFNTDAGRLTWVECGTGTPAPGGSVNRLWMDAANLNTPTPAVWMGTAADRTDAFGAGEKMRSFGAHDFTPPAMNVFTVTTGSVATDVTLTHFPSYHSHVAQ